MWRGKQYEAGREQGRVGRVGGAPVSRNEERLEPGNPGARKPTGAEMQVGDAGENEPSGAKIVLWVLNFV